MTGIRIAAAAVRPLELPPVAYLDADFRGFVDDLVGELTDKVGHEGAPWDLAVSVSSLTPLEAPDLWSQGFRYTVLAEALWTESIQ